MPGRGGRAQSDKVELPQPQLFELPVVRRPRDAEELHGALGVPLGGGEGDGEGLALGPVDGLLQGEEVGGGRLLAHARGEVVEIERLAGLQEEGRLGDLVLELAYVARPGVADQGAEGGAGDPW